MTAGSLAPRTRMRAKYCVSSSAPPTLSILLPLQGKIVAYSNQLVNIYNDRNFPSYPNHDSFKSIIFVDKHVQPVRYCLSSFSALHSRVACAL